MLTVLIALMALGAFAVSLYATTKSIQATDKVEQEAAERERNRRTNLAVICDLLNQNSDSDNAQTDELVANLEEGLRNLEKPEVQALLRERGLSVERARRRARHTILALRELKLGKLSCEDGKVKRGGVSARDDS